MPLLNIIGNVNQIKNPNISFTVPFVATGGVKETFVTGGISYTMHSFISGSGSFDIVQGSTYASVYIQAGGGAGAAGGPSLQTANGGGAGGGFVASVPLTKSTLYGVTSSYSVYVGKGAAYNGPFASSSNFIKAYDFNYIPYNPSQYIAYPGGNGGDSYQSGQNGGCGGGGGGTGSQGGNGGNCDAVTKACLSGGGGIGGNGGDLVTGAGAHAGFGGSGSFIASYFGGPSGSYPVSIGGGGGGGTAGNIAVNTYGVGFAINGGGNGGGFVSPTGSNGVQYTGAGGGGGYSNVTNGIYYPGGSGGDGVVRVVYVTQT
jgi:hypothetical protein